MIYCNSNNIIQSGDTLRFWAFVTDVKGSYLSNQDVVFYTVKDGVKTQIGSPVVTGSNGIAVCDYVGRGMGDIGIIAETEIDGTFVSETYNVIDGIFVDIGTIANHNDNWGTIQYFTRNNDGTDVYCQNTGTFTLRWYINNNQAIPVGDGLVLEMDIEGNKFVNDIGRMETDKPNQLSYVILENVPTDSKYRVEILPTGTYHYLNGSKIKEATSHTNNTVRIYFDAEKNTTTDYKFKNLRLYPI